jgi:hypothetical protein
MSLKGVGFEPQRYRIPESKDVGVISDNVLVAQ